MATPPASQPQGNLSPDTVELLKGLGVSVYAFDPNQVEAVLQGHMTLGELAGITKQKQYDMAQTGLKFLADGLRDKGLEVFKGLEALDPYDAYVQAILGQIAMEDEDFEEAERRFTHALFLNPTSVPALAARGELFLRLGRRTEGLADLESALKQDPIKSNDAVLGRVRALLDAARKAPAK